MRIQIFVTLSKKMDCTELIRGLSIELREQILKYLIKIKVRERNEMGWDKIHMQIKKLSRTNYERLMVRATHHPECIPIMRFCKECGTKNFDEALCEAADFS